MTDKKDKALKLALEALEKAVATCFDRYSHEHVMIRPEHFVNQAITAIRKALAEQPAQQQEPLFWYRLCSNGMYEGPIHDAQIESVRKESGAWHPLYTSPPASKPWVGLTEEQVFELIEANTEWKPAAGLWRLNEVEFARAIEANLREKNT